MKKVLTSCLVVLLLMFGASVVRAQEGEQVHYRGIITIVKNENYKVGEQFLDPIYVYNIPFSEDYELTIGAGPFGGNPEAFKFDGIDHYEKISDDEFIIYAKMTPLYEVDTQVAYFLEANGETYMDFKYITASNTSDYAYIVGYRTINGGNTYKYEVYYEESEGAMPVNVTEDVEWTSTVGENIATIDENGNLTASSTTEIKQGTITCFYHVAEGITYELHMPVKIVPDNQEIDYGIDVYTNYSFYGSDQHTGKQESLEYAIYDIDVKGISAKGPKIRITSSDESVANAYLTTYSEEYNCGYAQVVKKATGEATITFVLEFDGKEYTDTVKLNSTDDISGKIHISVDGEEIVKVDEEITLKADVKYDDRDIDVSKITWKSENPDIASVDNSGVVKGLKAGVATITVCVPYPEDDTRFISYSYDVTVEASEENKQVINGDDTTADTVIPQTGDIKALFIIPIGIIATYGIIKLRKYKNSLF